MESRWSDAGTILPAQGPAVRAYRQQAVTQVTYLDKTGNHRLEIVTPAQRVVYVPLETY